MRDIDTSLLRAFVAVIDSGNFSRAARQLNRTQSALSMQIKRLEELVDAPLFERTVRPPLVTPAGEALVAYAREILAINDAALATIKTNRLAGKVRLALMEDYAATRLAPILGAFLAEHPDVQVEVHTGLTGSFLNEIGSRFDVVLATTPVGSGDGEFLYRGASVWGAAPTFDPKRHDPLPLALYEHGCLFRKWSTDALDAAGRRWRMGVVSSSLGAIAASVREGWSASIFKANTLPAGLKILDESDGMPPLPDYEIRLFRAPSAGSGAAKSLADFLVERVPGDHALALSQESRIAVSA